VQLTTKLVHDVDFFIDTDTWIIEAGQLRLQVYTKSVKEMNRYLKELQIFTTISLQQTCNYHIQLIS